MYVVIVVTGVGDIMVDFNDIVNLGDVADGVDVADLTDVADVDNASDFAVVGNVSVDEGDACKWVIFLAVSYLGPKEVKCTSIFLEVSNNKCVTDVSLVVMDFPVVVVAVLFVVADVIFTTVVVAIDVAVDIFLAVSKPTLSEV